MLAKAEIKIGDKRWKFLSREFFVLVKNTMHTPVSQNIMVWHQHCILFSMRENHHTYFRALGNIKILNTMIMRYVLSRIISWITYLYCLYMWRCRRCYYDWVLWFVANRPQLVTEISEMAQGIYVALFSTSTYY